MCRDFRARLHQGLPNEFPTWVAGVGDVMTDRWIGRTTVDSQAVEQIEPDEWLLVEAWDES